MTRSKLVILFAVVAVGFAVGAYGVAYVVASKGSGTTLAASRATAASTHVGVPDATTQISFWSKRVADQPNAYLDLTLLGQAFVRKARETSDVGYYDRARAALRRALRVHPGHVPAVASLSSVLFSLHEFDAAVAVAHPIVDHPHGLQALATLGDAHLALGHYGRAQSAYARLRAVSSSPAAYSRLAFLADLRGQTRQALASMEHAARLAAASGDNGESLAWYSFQLGEMSFRAGEIDAAELRYRDALALFPSYPLALGGLAKTASARGETGVAIELYRRATAIAPQPDLLAALGDVYASAGNQLRAREQYATVGVVARLARANRQVYNRQLANFYADQGTRLDEARRLALGELRVRRDVYGLDAAAWALARSGRCAKALPYAERSLRLGTKDALLYFHRGYAEGCAGNGAAMREWYAKALALSPEFSVRWAPVARAAVDNG